MMPEMDGFAVCEKLRQRYSQADLPIIFVTAKNRIKDLSKGYKIGGNDYISKPFFKDELLARIEHQFTFLNAIARISDITEFANLIADITSIGVLSTKIYEFTTRIPNGVDSFLFKNKTLLKSTNTSDSQKAVDIFKPWISRKTISGITMKKVTSFSILMTFLNSVLVCCSHQSCR